MEIQEGNKLIAEFMGYKTTEWGIWLEDGDGVVGGFEWDHVKYHSSWEWLMPVVEKIEWMDNSKIDCYVKIERQECTIFYESDKTKYHWSLGGKQKIESVWQSVIQFIQWYNTRNE